MVLSEGLAVREDRRFPTGLRISKPPHHKTLDDYDFSFQPELDPRTYSAVHFQKYADSTQPTPRSPMQ
ncbi:ATP-binding protein [Streptomyces sp. Tu 2975]|uniref:ATP-binding protein n=1 Tax=Streptomyces sp. Tu 2975 TaxID=2676871 RepID=UPI001ABE1625|nr:ATP-binding protein [Streptomyces sp. Tu 2975]